MNPGIRITLFGRFEVQLRGEMVLDHAPSKVQELLAYLVLNRGRAHPREVLAELLWSDSESPHARKYLRQALWQLQAGLAAAGRARASRLVQQEPGWVELELDQNTWVDTVAFEETFNDVRGVRRLAPGVLLRVVEAVQLYRGDLLEGHCQGWCVYERDRFREMYLNLLDRLVEDSEAKGAHDAGVAYATLALKCDPARERTHRSLMSLHYRSGNRTAALRQYERCAAALRDELGIAPGRETEELRISVCAGTEVGSSQKSEAHAASPTLVIASNGRARSPRPLARRRASAFQH